MSAVQQEMKSRQDASLGSAHDVSSILQALLEAALRTNIPKLLVGKGPKGRYHLSSEVMSSKPSGSLIVTLL